MRRRLRFVVGLVGAMVVAAPGAGAEPAGTGAAPAKGGGLGSAVTLLTGDTVVVGPRLARVLPGVGREKVRFLQRIDERGDLVVVPSDVAALVSAGRLDGRLFNVSKLISNGYGDRERRDTPLIIDYAGAAPSTFSAGGVRQVRDLPSVGAIAVVADKTSQAWQGLHGAGPGSLSAGVERIWLDGPIRASLDHSVAQIGAPAAWASGYTGRGTTVAVLDTGIDATHPDLADAVTEAKNFTQSPEGTDDRVGHGTHVASIITGNNAKYQGVAPDTRLLNGKVLDDAGRGFESSTIAGMEWAAGKGADAVNMSLASVFPSDGTDPTSQAVNRLTEQTGTLFVVGAGNSGPEPETVCSPGAADAALTVGAVDQNDQLAPFSSRGPRRLNQAIKPDITAPGVGIVAARAKNGFLGDPVGEQHVAVSGTSMATPHVAGAAAIIAGQHPDWSAETIKAVLMGSAKPNPTLTVYEQGAGRVDVASAVRAAAVATPASLSQGIVRWPHNDDPPIVKTITYANTGSEPLTLDLAADVRDPAGAPAPAGMVTVQPGRITVPAGGSAPVSVTTNTAVPGPDGGYGGAISATGSGVSIRTPIGVTKEVESYDITMRMVDHNGKPAENYSLRFVDLVHPKEYLAYDPSGTVVARVPKGRFYLDAWVQTSVGDRQPVALAAEPQIVVTGDAELVIDARSGGPLGVTVDKTTAGYSVAGVEFDVETQWGDSGYGTTVANFEDISMIASRTSMPGKFQFRLLAQLAEPDGRGGFFGSPYLYNINHSVDGRVPPSTVFRIRDRDLVAVRSTASAQAPGKFGQRDRSAMAPLPFSITEYTSPDAPAFGSLTQLGRPDPRAFETLQEVWSPLTFSRGGPAVHSWNAAVFGPAFPFKPDRPAWHAGRLGNDMFASVPLFTDQHPAHAGYSRTDTGSTTLYRNGTKIGENPFEGGGDFPVPAGEASYRMHTEATRGGISELSTSISADWTFRSDTVAGAEQQPLPLLAIRFAPRLDSTNSTPAGRPFVFPVYVQRNGSPNPGTVATPAVDVSYDDGKTWKPARLLRAGSQWLAMVTHPADAKFVSLKASTGDNTGTAVTQTIIRAYKLS